MDPDLRGATPPAAPPAMPHPNQIAASFPPPSDAPGNSPWRAIVVVVVLLLSLRILQEMIIPLMASIIEGEIDLRLLVGAIAALIAPVATVALSASPDENVEGEKRAIFLVLLSSVLGIVVTTIISALFLLIFLYWLVSTIFLG